ncbi:MAG TPA: sugar MFS transporter [Gillisia sp.]|nr:sugar MFS transporter [Gillisia sp.]
MEKSTPRSSESGSNTTRSIIIIGALFFIFGFVTWLNSVLIPYLKIACELNNFQSYFVVTAFYISYLVMALPSAWVLEKTGYKKGMSLGLIVMAVGAVIFIPAAYSRTYELFLVGLFVQGTGLALLQTAANPYVVVLGPAESAAKRISIMGICNKVAGVLAPIVLGAILFTSGDNLIESVDMLQGAEKAAALDELAQRVVNPYLVMMAVLILLGALVYFSSLPEVDADAEDEELAKTNLNKKSIFQFPHLFLGTLALFLYVGVEVIAGDTIISYANEAHGIPLSEAKFFASFTLGAMIVGYVIGIFTIPKYISQENALKVSAILGLVFGLAAIFGNALVSVSAIALLGIANALVWPAIWPMALAGLGRFTKVGSSFLIMAIAGGAILPPVYGYFADWDPQQAYWILIPCYLYILFFATKGYKVGRNTQP